MPSMSTDAAPATLLTPSEAAILLRVSAATIYRLVRTGDLPGLAVDRAWEAPVGGTSTCASSTRVG